MKAGNGMKLTQPATAGELVLQNSRQAGTRRPLGAPTTFIGRTAGCDIRLNVDGVDPMHCVLIASPEGVQLRDLNNGQGTYVNDERVEAAWLSHGDRLKVGPFEFRVELSARAAPLDEMPLEDSRESVRIQAAAVAAQQIGLEEEEIRLQKRRADLQEQEEQLAAHLAEKQRQVQLWSEYTQVERETLRKEKHTHEKHCAKLEAELLQAKAVVASDQQKLIQERQRVNQVYQRLKQRWRKQWAAEREKYQKQARKLQADIERFKERQELVSVQQEAVEREVIRFNTDRELSTRQLQEGQTALKKDQDGWRRRRSLEMLALKTKTRELADTQAKVQEARHLLIAEKDAWDQQLSALRHELHGLNNRIVHQRACLKEQAVEIARLDALRREHRADAQYFDHDFAAVECEVEVVSEAPAGDAVSSSFEHTAEAGWLASLEQVASELADQRVHLLEQFASLAEIQTAWEDERDQACAALETVGRRLLAQEQSLADRHRRACADEVSLEQRRDEIEAMRQDIHIARVQLKASAELFEDDRRKRLDALVHQEKVLREQFASLTQVRQRWNSRRAEETRELRSKQAVLKQQHQETHEQRLKLFERAQEVDEEKRILAEKSLALEQYRQEIFDRAKDPAAQRRVERLRRRWLTINSTLIRNAKNERESVKKEMELVAAKREELTQKHNDLAETADALSAKHAMLEEKEATLKARQLFLDEELAKLKSQRRKAEDSHLRLEHEADTLANAIYADPDPTPIDNAA